MDRHNIEQIKALSKSLLPEIVSVRRHLHTYPEPAFKEYNTALYIASKLEEYGIPFVSGVANTGIVASIHGKTSQGKVIALRADMDALPIVEENTVDYKSKNQGFMHACGHDIHMASLLGTAKIINTLKDSFHGTIKLFFQPSEEVIPGGALKMIEEGVLLKR